MSSAAIRTRVATPSGVALGGAVGDAVERGGRVSRGDGVGTAVADGLGTGVATGSASTGPYT